MRKAGSAWIAGTALALFFLVPHQGLRAQGSANSSPSVVAGRYIQAIQKRDLRTVIGLTYAYQQDVAKIKAQNPKALWPKLLGEYYQGKITSFSKKPGYWQAYGETLGAMMGDPAQSIRAMEALLPPGCQWKISETRRQPVVNHWNGRQYNQETDYVTVEYPSWQDAPLEGDKLLQKAILEFTLDAGAQLITGMGKVSAGDAYRKSPLRIVNMTLGENYAGMNLLFAAVGGTPPFTCSIQFGSLRVARNCSRSATGNFYVNFDWSSLHERPPLPVRVELSGSQGQSDGVSFTAPAFPPVQLNIYPLWHYCWVRDPWYQRGVGQPAHIEMCKEPIYHLGGSGAKIAAAPAPAVAPPSVPAAAHRTVILDEFNGSTEGKASGITYVPTPNGEGAQFSMPASSRIEYPRGIPSQGTIEWWIKVSSGYYHQNYQLHANQPQAMIFSTDAQGGDVTWPGMMKLFVYANGKVDLYMAVSKYDRPPARHVIAMATPFRFNQWHSIGISYGSEGEYIRVDGRLVASAPGNTQTLGAAGNHQQPLDIPTVGDTVSHFWQPHQYDGGFTGVVDRFRASAAQRDWVLSAVNLPAKTAAGSVSNSGCSGAKDLGYSIQDGTRTYRVEGFGPAGPNRVHVFLDSRGAVVRDKAELERLAAGAWAKEIVADRYHTGNGSGQVQAALGADATLEGWENFTDLLARSTVESLKAVVTGGGSLETAPTELTLGMVKRQLTDPKVALAHWAHAGLEQSLKDYRQLEGVLPRTHSRVIQLADLQNIESLYLQANTLFSANQALAAALATTTWQQEFSNYLSSAVDELGSSLPSSGAFLTLQQVLTLEQIVGSTAQSFSAYKQSLDLALKVQASTQQKMDSWATAAAQACLTTASATPDGPAGQADIRSVDFRNFTYPSHCSTSDASLGFPPLIPVVKGEWNKTTSSGGKIAYNVGPPSYGDLLGNGREQAVIDGDCFLGNGDDEEVFVYGMKGGRPSLIQYLSPRDWDDPAMGIAFDVRKVRIEGKQIAISYDAGGYAARPAWTVTSFLQWNGSSFMRTRSTRQRFVPPSY